MNCLTKISHIYRILGVMGCWLFLLAIADCKKHEDPKPLTEFEKLPPATLEGKNTLGCLVNGKAMIATGVSHTSSFYQQGILSIGGGTGGTTNIGLGLIIRENNFTIQETSYPLTPPPYYNASFGISENGNTVCGYDVNNTILGQLTITKLDKKKYIVSGLFEFSTFLNGCDTIKITDGRFDMFYSP